MHARYDFSQPVTRRLSLSQIERRSRARAFHPTACGSGSRAIRRNLARAIVLALVLGTGSAASAQVKFSSPSSSASLGGGLTVTAQVNLVFEVDGGNPGFLQTTFTDGVIGERATNDYVLQSMNCAAVSGLAMVAANGVRKARADVVAIAYRVGVSGTTVQTRAPMGVFLSATDMNVAVDGQAAFHTRIQMIPYALNEAAQAR